MKFDEYGRREMARRLRERAPETYVGLYEAVMGRQVAPDSRWGDDARELCERLAGLIEPREPRPGKVRVGERLYVAADFPCGSMLVAGDEVEVVDVTKHSALVHQHGGQCWYVMHDQLTHRAPVLAADGKPLEVGQTVWTVDAGIKFEVHSIEGDTVWGSLDGDRTDDGLDPKSLTHQRPVLDADGRPLCEGETVWFTTSGREIRVDKIEHRPEGFWALELFADGSKRYSAPVSILAHEPPDSWERIADEIDRLREEVALHLGDYLYDEDGNDSIQFSMECVAKRCRALAERGQ